MITFFIFIFIIGLCIGSFLNVVILRTLSGESIVFPSSKCPKCGHRLKWWHNIPILSYIILRGKCGFCKEKISIQYPIVELLTGIIFVLIFLKFENLYDVLFALIITSLFIVISGTDWKEQVVYDRHTYSLIGVGLVYAIIPTVMNLYADYTLLGHLNLTKEWALINPLSVSLLGIIGGFVLMEIISRIGYIFAGDRAFGEGDSFILAGLGAVYGWRMILPILILAVIIQIICILPIYIKKEINNKNWIVLVAISCFALYTGAFIMATNFGWLSNNISYIIGVIVLVVLGFLTCREILRGIKTPENRTYLPFGPALLLAGLIFLLV